MRIITLDFETFWDTDHSLSKMSPMAYVMSPRTELISLAIKVNHHPTDVFFGEKDIRRAVKSVDWSDTLVVAHNMSGFDAMICAWRLGIRPKMWGCTLAMARPIHSKTTGNSLGKLVEHYGLGHKDASALHNTKGRNLKDFTESEIDAMRTYNRADVEQCHALFNVLKPHYSAKEMWHIDASIRMLIDPQFEVDAPLLETALSIERDHKRRAILTLGRHLKKTDLGSEAVVLAASLEDLEEAVRTDMASAPRFAKLLESLGVDVPMKPSPTHPDDKQVPALAKTDEAFLALQDHDNEVVAAAARARLSVKSTLLETRIQAFLDASAPLDGRLPAPLNYCGADTTGRWSGWAYNLQNLPRVDTKKPRTADALRKSLKAPKGHQIVVADLSGIELRVNHFLWKVPSSMRLYRDSPGGADLYRDFASRLYNIPESEVSKPQRQVGKVAHLGLGFGAGPATFKDVAKLMGGVDLSEAEAADVTYRWREEYAPIVDGWRKCHSHLPDIDNGSERRAIDPWGLCVTEPGAIRLPSGRLIRYPTLRREPGDKGRDEWWYGEGRHKTRIYAGKIDENIVQALARDVIADNAVDVFKTTGLRPALMVHDELVYVVPEADAQGVLDTVQTIMRTPPKWWPELVTWSEGDIADTYGAAK